MCYHGQMEVWWRLELVDQKPFKSPSRPVTVTNPRSPAVVSATRGREEALFPDSLAGRGPGFSGCLGTFPSAEALGPQRSSRRLEAERRRCFRPHCLLVPGSL